LSWPDCPWDALLFDYDGVLADTEPLHFACWNEVLLPFGIQVTWDFYQKECVGVTDRLMIERLVSARTPPLPFDEVYSQYPRKRAIFRERVLADPPFPEQTRVLLGDLSQSFNLAIVSSSERTEVEGALVSASLRQHFQSLVCGREVPNLKPAPDPYLRAAELLGASRPLVVEDSEAGVASGRAAGFDVLRVSGPHTMAAELRNKLRSQSPQTPQF
jgi:beta-phosphoglucomutase